MAIVVAIRKESSLQDEVDQIMGQAGNQRKGELNQIIIENRKNQGNVSQVDMSFIEEGHVIMVNVGAEDEKEFPPVMGEVATDASDSETEVSASGFQTMDNATFNSAPLNQLDRSEGEIIEEDSQNEEGKVRVDLPCETARVQSRKRHRLSEDLDRAGKIKEIDNEMLKKLTELHELMSGQGMTELVAMLEKCASVMQSKNLREKIWQRSQQTYQQGKNQNVNANVTPSEIRKGRSFKIHHGKSKGQGKVTFNMDDLEADARSIETVYEDAVKREEVALQKKIYSLTVVMKFTQVIH